MSVVACRRLVLSTKSVTRSRRFMTKIGIGETNGITADWFARKIRHEARNSLTVAQNSNWTYLKFATDDESFAPKLAECQCFW